VLKTSKDKNTLAQAPLIILLIYSRYRGAELTTPNMTKFPAVSVRCRTYIADAVAQNRIGLGGLITRGNPDLDPSQRKAREETME
jgi:hypothetical protein